MPLIPFFVQQQDSLIPIRRRAPLPRHTRNFRALRMHVHAYEAQTQFDHIQWPEASLDKQLMGSIQSALGQPPRDI